MHLIRGVRNVNTPSGGQCWRDVKKVLGAEHPLYIGVDNYLHLIGCDSLSTS